MNEYFGKDNVKLERKFQDMWERNPGFPGISKILEIVSKVKKKN